MRKEESLVKVNNGVFAKIYNFFRNIFKGKIKKLKLQ